MANLTAARDTKKLGNAPSEPGDMALPVAASTILYQGSLCLADAAGNATKTNAATNVGVGRVRREVDNSSGSAGDKIVEVDRGVFKFANSDSITIADRFNVAYLVDDQTVSKGTGGGTRARAGIIWDVDSDGVWVLVGSAATLQNMEVGSRVRSYTRVFDEADTDVSVAATSATINLGAPLPSGAVVLAVIADVTEDWSDGGAATFAADVGDGTDADKFTPTELDIDNGVALLTQSVAIPAGGDQLVVTFTGSVNLSTLTTGTMTLKVLYTVPDDVVIAAP